MGSIFMTPAEQVSLSSAMKSDADNHDSLHLQLAFKNAARDLLMARGILYFDYHSTMIVFTIGSSHAELRYKSL